MRFFSEERGWGTPDHPCTSCRLANLAKIGTGFESCCSAVVVLVRSDLLGRGLCKGGCSAQRSSLALVEPCLACKAAASGKGGQPRADMREDASAVEDGVRSLTFSLARP